MWLHWQQRLTFYSSRSPGVPRYLLGWYGALGGHWWGWWRRWPCQNFGHLYLLHRKDNFHRIHWRQGKYPSTQPTFCLHQFSLPKLLWLRVNGRNPGWPWLLWRPKCRLRWGDSLKQPFFVLSPSFLCIRECSPPFRSIAACLTVCQQHQWYADLHYVF